MSVVVGQRHISDTPYNNKCYAVDSALDLAQHTLIVCSNENIFDPRYKDTVTKRLTDEAIAVYTNAQIANNIRVEKNIQKFNERDSRQRAAIVRCNELLAMINLAKRVFHLRHKKVEYWIEKAVKTRDLLVKWNDSEYRRYFEPSVKVSNN